VFAISDESGIGTRYVISNDDVPVESTLFAVELNLTLLAGDSEDRFYEVPGVEIDAKRMNSIGALDSVKLMKLVDTWMGIAIIIECKPVATFWRFPIETVSQSEGGFERTYQGSCVTAVWPLSLRARGSAECSLSIRVEPL
jgi:alpha-amylase